MTATLLPGPTIIDAPEPRIPAPPVPAPPRRPAHPPGGTGDPRWVKPAVLALLGVTAVLYLWGLGASGWANSFYSAAVQAGAKSWKAMFFGSSDAANFITVDKPPAALWVMEISARLFGVNAWSILVPQALEGVAAVGVIYLAVRRWFGAGAGLIAGAVLALTPVAALMFRFNNPDALLVLLLTGAAYATVRAIEGGRTRWLILAATLIGFGFLTKMLQAFVVVPVFALAYLIAGPPKLGRRLLQLAGAGVALVVSSLWWVAAVMAIPASDRPFIGGSQNNSLWNLIVGYNGFGRLTGNESGSVGGGGGTASRWGATGLFRMFNSEFGSQISWLLPAALILLLAGLVMTWNAARTDRTRASLVIWGGWLGLTGLVFSLGQGIIHPYYTVALAPAIGAVVAVGAVTLWRQRANWWARAVLAVALAATSIWSYILLRRTPSWYPVLAQRRPDRGPGCRRVDRCLVPSAGPADRPHRGCRPAHRPRRTGRLQPPDRIGHPYRRHSLGRTGDRRRLRTRWRWRRPGRRGPGSDGGNGPDPDQRPDERLRRRGGGGVARRQHLERHPDRGVASRCRPLHLGRRRHRVQ